MARGFAVNCLKKTMNNKYLLLFLLFIFSASLCFYFPFTSSISNENTLFSLASHETAELIASVSSYSLDDDIAKTVCLFFVFLSAMLSLIIYPFTLFIVILESVIFKFPLSSSKKNFFVVQTIIFTMLFLFSNLLMLMSWSSIMLSISMQIEATIYYCLMFLMSLFSILMSAWFGFSKNRN